MGDGVTVSCRSIGPAPKSARPCRRLVMSLSCQVHPWRRLRPRVIAACGIIAAIEERNHVSLVERFAAGVAEVGWNARKVKVDSVALGDGIDTIEISNPLILDKRGDG